MEFKYVYIQSSGTLVEQIVLMHRVYEFLRSHITIEGAALKGPKTNLNNSSLYYNLVRRYYYPIQFA